MNPIRRNPKTDLRAPLPASRDPLPLIAAARVIRARTLADLARRAIAALRRTASRAPAGGTPHGLPAA